MKFLSLYACTFGIYAAVAQPYIRAAVSQAKEVQNLFEKLQENIHTEAGIITEALNKVGKDSSDEEKDVAVEAFKVGFGRMIAQVDKAADSPIAKQAKLASPVSARNDLEERQLNLAPILIGIFNSIQAITGDLGPLPNQFLSVINHSEIVQALAGGLFNGLFGLIELLLTNLLKLPKSTTEPLRQLLKFIIGSIPV